MGTRPQGRALAFPVLWGQAESRTSTSSAKLGSLSDEELMAGLKRADPTALGLLFGRHSRLVLRIALRILGDYGEAEDVVQEVFVYLFQKAALFDVARGSPRTWIVQLAYHRALDRREYLTSRCFYRGTDIGELGDTLMGETDLDSEVGRCLDRERLEKAFNELPERQRAVLEMFFFDGLDFWEIAGKIGETWVNARHHYYRGLRKLRDSGIVRKLREK